MKQFTVIIEQAEGNLAAYVPELPGGVATGRTEREAQQRIKEAIEFHLEGMDMEDMGVPPCQAMVRQVEVAA